MSPSEDGPDTRQSSTKTHARDSLVNPSVVLSAAGVIITAIISLTNIYTTSVQKNKELQLQELKNESDQRFSRGQMILANIKQLNSPDENEKKLVVATLIWTLGPKEAEKLFSSIQQFGPSEAQPAAQSARAQIQDAKIEIQERVRAWSGKWKHTLDGRRGVLGGDMTIRSTSSGELMGEYITEGGRLTGKISGLLSEDGRLLTGNWHNSARQRGIFHLTLAEDGQAYQGTYVISEGSSRGRSGSWQGKRAE
jgi:hypothetical protein